MGLSAKWPVFGVTADNVSQLLLLTEKRRSPSLCGTNQQEATTDFRLSPTKVYFAKELSGNWSDSRPPSQPSQIILKGQFCVKHKSDQECVKHN